MTSSPAFTPAATSAIWIATVPLQQGTPKRAWCSSEKRQANSPTFFPPMPHTPERSVSSSASSSRRSKTGHFGQGRVRTGEPPCSASFSAIAPSRPSTQNAGIISPAAVGGKPVIL